MAEKIIYLENGHLSFGHVIQFLKEGKTCRRLRYSD